MSTQPTDLASWLLARIADEEEVARAALHPDAIKPGEWVTEHHNSEYHSEPDRAHIAEDSSGHYWSVAHDVFIPIAEHIARHDPARVLAECQAKRAIVKMHRQYDLPGCDGYETHGREDCLTLRLLALPYADHNQFQEEWRV